MRLKHLTLFALYFAPVIAIASSPVPFWSEDFGAGFPSGWSSEDELSTGMDAVFWEHCDDFSSCPPTTFNLINVFKDERFESSSVSNGYVFIKPFGEGSSTAPHNSYLQSPSIDCSDQQQVFLRFNTLILASQSNPDTDAVVEVRAGNSGPWTSFEVFYNLNEELVEAGLFGIQSYNPQMICLDISGVAAGSDAVYIRWTWNYAGDEEFFWVVDDIELLSEDPLHERAIWGHLPAQGDFPGGLNGWTIFSTGDCGFEWDQNALVDIPDQNPKADFYGCSCTAPNGVVLVNASWCFPEVSYSELISPTIDLSSSASGKSLSLRFHQTGSLGNPANSDKPVTFVLLSLDDGLTYADTFGINRDKAFQEVFCETEVITLPQEYIGQEKVRVKFIFHGQITFWMLDDIAVVERYDHDLALLTDNYSVAPDFSTPACLVRPFGFAVGVENVGNLSQTSATACVVVKNDDSGAVAHADTVVLGEIGPDEVIEDVVFPKTFAPPAEPANYTCYYRLSGPMADEDTLNNVIRWKFEVTQSLYSKTKGNNAINGAFTPFDDLVYEVGNCYFIPPGSGVLATKLSFAFGNANNLFGATFRTNLYQWKTTDSWGDENMDTLANQTEYELIAFNLYQVDGDESLRDVITIPVDFESEGIALEDSTYYFVTVEYNDPIVGPGGQVPFFIAASEEIDYATTFVQSYQTGLPAYFSMLRLGTDNYFRANSWGLRRIPYVQLHIEKLTPSVERLKKDIPIEVFPNPAANQIFVNAGLEGIQHRVSVEIIDIWGRVVGVRQFENAIVSHLPIDLLDLSNGCYILRLISDDKAGATMFVVSNH